jgi:cytochrome c-type biogenesis protein CcmH/NrfG
MENENRQEIIDLYLQGELTSNLLKDFEEQLKEDKMLQKDVILSKDVLEALDSAKDEQMFGDKLSALKLGDKYLVASKTKESNQKKSIIITFLVIATIAISLFMWKKLSVPQVNKQVFANYYEPYPSNASTRGINNIDQNYLNAIEAYDNKNYSEAIKNLTQRLESHSQEISTQLLLANSYMNTSPSETQKAIDILKSVIENQAYLYSITAKWYLALAYLQNKQNNKAKIIFEELALNKSGKYPKLSKEILSNWE